jgi:hypothetical protein
MDKIYNNCVSFCKWYYFLKEIIFSFFFYSKRKSCILLIHNFFNFIVSYDTNKFNIKKKKL